MRFFPGPQGLWVCKNCGWCGSTSAPEFAEPPLPVQIAFPLQGGRWHGEAVTDEGGFLKHTPTGFRWTVGAAFGRPQAFPFRGRCPQRGRMRGTALIMQAVRFPRAAEGGGPYRWGHLMPRRAAARTAPTQAKDRFQLTCRGGACPSRSVFRRRGGPVCPPGCTGPQSSGHTHRCAPTGISAIPRKNRGGQRLPQGRPVSAPTLLHPP